MTLKQTSTTWDVDGLNSSRTVWWQQSEILSIVHDSSVVWSLEVIVTIVTTWAEAWRVLPVMPIGLLAASIRITNHAATLSYTPNTLHSSSNVPCPCAPSASWPVPLMVCHQELTHVVDKSVRRPLGDLQFVWSEWRRTQNLVAPILLRCKGQKCHPWSQRVNKREQSGQIADC